MTDMTKSMIITKEESTKIDSHFDCVTISTDTAITNTMHVYRTMPDGFKKHLDIELFLEFVQVGQQTMEMLMKMPETSRQRFDLICNENVGPTVDYDEEFKDLKDSEKVIKSIHLTIDNIYCVTGLSEILDISELDFNLLFRYSVISGKMLKQFLELPTEAKFMIDAHHETIEMIKRAKEAEFMEAHGVGLGSYSNEEGSVDEIEQIERHLGLTHTEESSSVSEETPGEDSCDELTSEKWWTDSGE